MTRALPLRIWLAFWRVMQRYHRYSVEGLERLDGPRPALIVGYHGCPFAFDVCMLTVTLHDRLGYLPHGIVHRGVDLIPPLKWLADGLGFVRGDGRSIESAIGRGEHIVTTPGGAREGCRSFRDRYRVSWGDRAGYVRLAIRHRLRIVPVAAAGADGTYIGLNDGERLGRRLGLPPDWAWIPWIGLGPLGIFPFSPPFPVRMRQVIGEPIDPEAEDVRSPDDVDGVRRIHARVKDAVQALLDRARAEKPR